MLFIIYIKYLNHDTAQGLERAYISFPFTHVVFAESSQTNL